MDIYDILIECGADVEDRRRFEQYLEANNNGLPFEWRFQGKLGFGGKFYKTETKQYVSCYPEDLNLERRAIMDLANKKLSNP